MSSIVSRAFILFTDSKHKDKIYTFFWDKMLYVEKLIPFSLYASDNLVPIVHILHQLGNFHAQYTNHKN